MNKLAQIASDFNQRVGSPQPPTTNRGVEVSHLQECVFSIDWLRLTIFLTLEAAQPLISILGLDGLEETGHGGLGFKRVLRGLNGFQVYCEPTSGAAYISLNLPSKCLQVVGVDRLRLGIDWLCEQALSSGVRWQATRLDLAFDTQKFSVQQFAEAYHSGRVETKSRDWEEIRSKDGSHTFYVGSRKSSALLRVYHKTDGCSFGDDAFTRVELELKADRAAMALSEIFAAPVDAWASMAAGWLMGFVEVREEWWGVLIEGAKRAWLKLRQNVPTVASIQAWVERQVLPSLAVLVGATSGGDLDEMRRIFDGFMAAGRARFTDRHWSLIENYKPQAAPEFAVFGV